MPIAGFDPARCDGATQVEARIADLAAKGYAGVKLHPRLNDYDPLDDRSLAAIHAAGRHGLTVFLCTPFRQRRLHTRHPADVVDAIATGCPASRIVLLHGGSAHLLEMFEMIRMHRHLLLDLSFTLLRYAGSSLDQGIRFICEVLDQRVTVGSDFPEYTPGEARRRILELTEGLAPEKRENILCGNLDRLFAHWTGLSSVSHAAGA